MAVITNLRHFLTDKGKIADLSDEGIELAYFLVSVVADVSIADDKSKVLVDTPCRLVEENSCLGGVEASLGREDHCIYWVCDTCLDQGRISDWEGTKWDHSEKTHH